MEAKFVAKFRKLIHFDSSSSAFVFCKLDKLLNKRILIIAVLFFHFFLPEWRDHLLEVTLNAPIRPLELPWLLLVLIKIRALVERPLTPHSRLVGVRIDPGSHAASPVRFPKHFVRVSSRSCSRHLLSRVPKVPLSRMAPARFLVVVGFFVDLGAGPVQAVPVFVL